MPGFACHRIAMETRRAWPRSDGRRSNNERVRPVMGTILLVILIILLLGALPTWPYSGGWGYYPSGGLGLVLLIVIILLVLGRI
jgi:hypothetical protein